MSDEMKRTVHQHMDVPPSMDKTKRSRELISDYDLINQKKDLFPGINLAMNMMKMPPSSQVKEESENECSSVKEDRSPDPERVFLRDKLQEKLNGLLEEQRALLGLYIKAAKAARDKEEEYKERIAELIEQLEKDRQLMDLFRSL